jgi:hypothetical protein
MSCCPVWACHALLIEHEYIFLGGGALLVDRSTRTDSGARAPIYPAVSALRLDRAEIRAKVECDLMKRSHILSS